MDFERGRSGRGRWSTESRREAGLLRRRLRGREARAGLSGAEAGAAGLGAAAGVMDAQSGRGPGGALGAERGAAGVLPARGRCCHPPWMFGAPSRDCGCWSLFCPCGKVLFRASQGQEEIAEGTLEMPAGRITLHPGPGTHREAESPG